MSVSSTDWAQLQGMLAGWKYALRLMIEEWPEQAIMADFKGQTPLMLVADHGDVAQVTLLAPLSDVNAQDLLGRTALHAAVASRSPECVHAVLEQLPAVDDKVSIDEKNTALHTAVRFGHPECVRLISDAFPSLLDKRNAEGVTPLAMANDIQRNWSDWAAYMQRQNRAAGGQAEFDEIVKNLHRIGSAFAI